MTLTASLNEEIKVNVPPVLVDDGIAQEVDNTPEHLVLLLMSIKPMIILNANDVQCGSGRTVTDTGDLCQVSDWHLGRELHGCIIGAVHSSSDTSHVHLVFVDSKTCGCTFDPIGAHPTETPQKE